MAHLSSRVKEHPQIRGLVQHRDTPPNTPLASLSRGVIYAAGTEVSMAHSVRNTAIYYLPAKYAERVKLCDVRYEYL